MSSEENEGKKSSFRVQDNRRFDAEGNDRAGGRTSSALSSGSGQGATSGGSQIQQAKNDPQENADRSSRKGGGEIDFSSFIVSLATQALMQLGVMKVPDSVSLPVDVGAAKQTIDLLVMLEEKTKGNLDADEERLMEEIVHNLRMSYVKVAGV